MNKLMKQHLLLLACLLITATRLPGQAPAPTVYTGAQILPFLRLYDLQGLGDFIQKSDSVSSKEVAISFDEDAWNHVPFKKLLVADDYAALKTADDTFYALCPFLPPTLEKLSEARSYQEVLQTLLPPSRSGNEAFFSIMDVPTSTQSLEESNDSYDLRLRAAYLQQDRIVWIECLMTYKESQAARSTATPFLESVIQIHISPKYK